MNKLRFHKWHSDYIRYPVEGTRIANYGEFRSGKTTATGVKILEIIKNYPGSNGAIIRNTHPDLVKSTIPQFRKLYEQTGEWNFNQTHKDLSLPGGGHLFFLALDREDDARKLKNIELGFAWIEQAEEIHVNVFNMLEGRLSQLPNCILVTGNPEGKGWDFYTFFAYPVNEMTYTFLPDCPEGDSIEPKSLTYGMYRGERGENYVGFLPPPYLNEPNLPVQYYYYNLIKKNPQTWVDKYVYRLFTGNTGLLHKDFNDSHVLKPNDYFLPSNICLRYEAMDYGVANPTAWLFSAYSREDKTLYVMDEHYIGGENLSFHAPIIQSMRDSYGKPVWTVGCPRAFQSERDGSTPADEYNTEYNIFLEPFPIGIETRVEICNRWFKQNKVKIFSRCHNLIRQLEGANWKNLKTFENHALEAFHRLISRLDSEGGYSTVKDFNSDNYGYESITANMMTAEF